MLNLKYISIVQDKLKFTETIVVCVFLEAVHSQGRSALPILPGNI